MVRKLVVLFSVNVQNDVVKLCIREVVIGSKAPFASMRGDFRRRQIRQRLSRAQIVWVFKLLLFLHSSIFPPSSSYSSNFPFGLKSHDFTSGFGRFKIAASASSVAIAMSVPSPAIPLLCRQDCQSARDGRIDL